MEVLLDTVLYKNKQDHWLSANQLILLTCAYMALVLNFPFLQKAYHAVTINNEYNIWFLLSIPLMLCALFLIINSVLAFSKLLKPILIVSVLVSTSIFYATLSYGIVFDYSMVQNTVQSDTTEALSYFNLNFLGVFFLFGVLPAVLIWKANITPQPVLGELFSGLKLFVGSVVVVALIMFLFFSNYAAVGRNNHDLINYITPYKFVSAGIKYAKRTYFTPAIEYTLLDSNPFIVDTGFTPTVTVLVVGETARTQNFSLNGYAKNTNPYTDDARAVSFTNVSSCGTATAVSVPCMFSRLNRNNFDNQIASSQQNVLDIASLAGTDVLWIDNNNGSCKGVCNRLANISIEPDESRPFCDNEYCLDEALLIPLQEKLTTLTHHDTLIVLHMMGSHGPTYYRRYPKENRVFLPDCQRSDIQNCSEQELVNSYDNTIAYTDFVLGKIINTLSSLSEQRDIQSSLVYISDHGESLGEHGIYLHGMPYAFAPKEQTQVPMLFWQTASHHSVDTACLIKHRTQALSHDNLFDLILGITSVKSRAYDTNQDPFAQCRQPDDQLALIYQQEAALVN